MSFGARAKLFIVAACFFTAGCSTNVSRFQMPGTDLSQITTLHVNPIQEERGAAELRALVDVDLKQRGYEVESRTDSTVLSEGDYVLDIAADWHWDLSWYLLELRVAIYEAANNTLVAQAQSQQTSLARKSNLVVVQRTLASLFNDEPETDGGR